MEKAKHEKLRVAGTPAEKEITLKWNDSIAFPVGMIPNARTKMAIQSGVERNLLLKTWGGIGDQICSEPTLRMALKAFTPKCNVSLASELPYLFKHIPFKRVFDLHDREVLPAWEKYFVFDTIVPPDHLMWSFFSHCLTNCVDFPAMCAFRLQLPVQDREIYMTPEAPTDENIKILANKKMVIIHAGKHWPTKTFPKDWWDGIVTGLIEKGITPILIGADADDNRGTVDIETEGCIDLRNKTSISDCLWLCQRATVLLTNDSSPLHMSASRNPNDAETGKTWIGYFATCKHPDYITHWRKPLDSEKLIWNWREVNLSVGGIWEIVDNCPNVEGEVTIDKIDEKTLRTWLPEIESVVEWTLEKYNS